MTFKQFFFAAILGLMIVPTAVFAQNFSRDLLIESDAVRFNDDILVGDTVRIYATVKSASKIDLSGVVKFYDETAQQFVGSDQPISVLAGGTDDVFIDWSADSAGVHQVAIRVFPWQESGDNPDNNKITAELYVDIDTDGDGIGNRLDPDDDNDDVIDRDDDFPLDPEESKDTDGDGFGNIADTDDDGDGVEDVLDIFPLDPNESVDSDEDGVGDNSDAFPDNPLEWADQDADGLGDNADEFDDNKGPTPVLTFDSGDLLVGRRIVFDAAASTDEDGEVQRYEWDFGDGTTAVGENVLHAYSDKGEYSLILRVYDNRGEFRQLVQDIVIKRPILPTVLVVASLLLAFLLLLLLFPGSRFYYQRLFPRFAPSKTVSRKKK